MKEGLKNLLTSYVNWHNRLEFWKAIVTEQVHPDPPKSHECSQSILEQYAKRKGQRRAKRDPLWDRWDHHQTQSIYPLKSEGTDRKESWGKCNESILSSQALGKEKAETTRTSGTQDINLRGFGMEKKSQRKTPRHSRL